MALTALNLAALPVIGGLMVGTGAMATYVVGPATAPVEVAAPKPKSCDTQTWPYIENRCVAGRVEQTRKVRLVTAARDGTSDATIPEAAVAPKMDAPPAAANLVTRDTVGRSVEPVAAQAMPEPVSRRVEKRRARDERKLARQAYQVPSEASARRDTRPVIVVRPLRLDMFK